MGTFSPLQIYPIHHCKKFINACCDLINSEWPRSRMARYQSLHTSCENFPTSFVLILNDEEVVGHCKVSEIRNGGSDVFVESVIIRKDCRGVGWGKILMEYAEEYCRIRGKMSMYLSTKGQEGFYFKLGFEVCKPINYFGFCNTTPRAVDVSVNENNNKNNNSNNNDKQIVCANAPPPPPLPNYIVTPPLERHSSKTYMKKNIQLMS